MKRQAIFVLMVLFVFTSIVQATLTAYIGGNSNNIYSTNLNTGEQSQFSINGINGNFGALAISPIDRTLYAIAGGNDFYRVDIEASNATFIGSLALGGAMHNLAFTSDGILYGLNNYTTLVTINTETAETDIIGNIVPMNIVPSSQAFAIDSTGQGIGWVMDGYSWSFMKIDLNDASGVRVSEYMSDYHFSGLDFALDGKLYAWESKNQKLYEVNTGNYSITYVKSFAYGGYGGFVVTPEPATILLFGFGTMLLRKRLSVRKRTPLTLD